ncbi:hypothetical protein ACHAWF_007921, partial [Thalassiosira exigua]
STVTAAFDHPADVSFAPLPPVERASAAVPPLPSSTKYELKTKISRRPSTTSTTATTATATILDSILDHRGFGLRGPRPPTYLRPSRSRPDRSIVFTVGQQQLGSGVAARRSAKEFAKGSSRAARPPLVGGFTETPERQPEPSEGGLSRRKTAEAES